MLSPKEKEFFASATWGAASLSSCGRKHGAVLVGREYGTLSFGFNRTLTIDLESSAIQELLLSGVPKGSTIFSTKFPSHDDMKLLLAANLLKIYFFGEVNDMDSVKLVNDWNLVVNSEDVLEMIQLEMGAEAQITP